MASVKSRTHRRSVFWVAAPVLCLACAVVGGAVVSGWGAKPATASPKTAKDAPTHQVDTSANEIGALRAEVQRLGMLVGALAASIPSGTAAPAAPAAEIPKERPSVPLPPHQTVQDVVARYEAAPPNSMKTRTVASSLGELMKKESLAGSKLEIETVECRGEACRVRVSFDNDAPQQALVMELAALIPDSHSFSEAVPAGNNRRALISHYIDDSATAHR
jgi:hypothetical protein